MKFPNEVIVDPTPPKQVIITPEVERAFPGVVEAFDEVDDVFRSYNQTSMQQLESSVFSFRSATGANIDYSLLPGKGSRLLTIWAPFSDSAPRSTATDIYSYMKAEHNPGMAEKVKAAPNSWSQLTKSAVIWELLKVIGHEMPVLTIFSPLPSVPHNAYTHNEYKLIRRGDFRPAAYLFEEAVNEAQDRLHGLKSETQLDEFDFHGASLGASHAIGAAAGYNARSVTAQELIVAPKNLIDLALRFTVKDTVGAPSELQCDEDLFAIDEPSLRDGVDRAGNEPMVVARMLQGMSKVTRLKGLTRPDRNVTPRLIEELAGNGTSVMIPLAENSGLTYDTQQYLPDAGEHIVTVRALQGERVNHLIDEHVGLTALLAVMNVRNS